MMMMIMTPVVRRLSINRKRIITIYNPCHYRDCKALLSMCSCSSAISSTGPLPFIKEKLRIAVCSNVLWLF